jgi:hypothetical protein
VCVVNQLFTQRIINVHRKRSLFVQHARMIGEGMITLSDDQLTHGHLQCVNVIAVRDSDASIRMWVSLPQSIMRREVKKGHTSAVSMSVQNIFEQ